jgi:hypothetical protein
LSVPNSIDALRRVPSLGALVGGVVAFIGLLIGLGPLNDNSYLTHLATGRIIWDTHHIPHSDPYSFTAFGHPWVVQSWLASVIYGAADRWWGPPGVLLVVAAAASSVAALVWTLTRPAHSLLGRLLIVAPLLLIGADGGWVERPLLFGVLALCLVLLAAEGRLDPRWLLPTMWFWVNTHGSFPLGLVAIGLMAIGRRLDQQSPATEVRALKWAVLGTLLGAVNPLGPRLLVFPIELLRRQDILSNIIEWQAPQFVHVGQRAFLFLLLLAIIALVRRPSWRAGLPLVVFTAASLLGSRNIVVASIVFVPGLARGLVGVGTVTGDERRPLFRPMAAAVALIGVLAVVVAAQGPVYSLTSYPVAAVTWAEREGLLKPGARLVTQDFVGNYLESRYGTSLEVFMDDRYDMFPATVVNDYITLLHGDPGWQEVLDRNGATAVLWAVDEPLGQLLAVSPRWRVVYSDQHFLIAEPR